MVTRCGFGCTVSINADVICNNSKASEVQLRTRNVRIASFEPVAPATESPGGATVLESNDTRRRRLDGLRQLHPAP
jgi:hypothetical protein